MNVNGTTSICSDMKEDIPAGFTAGMAFMDALPVLFFSISISVLAHRFSSSLFLIGAMTVITAGALKAAWKFMLAFARKNISFLNRQMRYLMPAGFILMLFSLLIHRDKISIKGIFTFPALLFFICGLAGILCMIFFARHFNGQSARANWIEQGTNTVTQFFIMLGIIFA